MKFYIFENRFLFMNIIIVSTIIAILLGQIMNLIDSNYEMIEILLTLLVITIIFMTAQIIVTRHNPISKTVAILGFPKSGKTTLLISLFGEIFAGNLPIRITPRGTKNIERINESLEMIERGRALGPTKDQDRFSFRADVTMGNLIPRTYKVEFGDFPGEESQKYSEEYGSWLHNNEFFKWVIDSDALIFVIDLGLCLARDKNKKDYIAKMTKAFRATWQNFVDNNENRINEAKKLPLILVFTKADLFGVKKYGDNWDIFEDDIAKIGFGKDIPPIMDINQEAFEKGQIRVKEDFAELIQYFDRENPNFQVLFTSSFGIMHGKRLGFKELMMAVLPH